MDFTTFQYITAAVFVLNLLMSFYEVFKGRRWSLLALPLQTQSARRLWTVLVVVWFGVAVASPFLTEGRALLDWSVSGFILLLSLLSIFFRLRRGIGSEA